MKLEGKNALVTGAATGIGREIAETLAGKGAEVALVDKDSDGLEQTRESIAEDGGGRRTLLRS